MMYDYIKIGISTLTFIVAIVAFIKVRRTTKMVHDMMTISETKTGDSIDLARRNIAATINIMKISMFDEIERLVGIKNNLEKDLEKNPNNAMIIAKLEEIKRLIKVASLYYEVDVM